MLEVQSTTDEETIMYSVKSGQSLRSQHIAEECLENEMTGQMTEMQYDCEYTEECQIRHEEDTISASQLSRSVDAIALSPDQCGRIHRVLPGQLQGNIPKSGLSTICDEDVTESAIIGLSNLRNASTFDKLSGNPLVQSLTNAFNMGLQSENKLIQYGTRSMEMSARVMHRAFGTHLEVLDGYLSKQIDRIEERFPGIIEGDVVYRTLQDNAMKVKEMLKEASFKIHQIHKDLMITESIAKIQEIRSQLVSTLRNLVQTLSTAMMMFPTHVRNLVRQVVLALPDRINGALSQVRSYIQDSSDSDGFHNVRASEKHGVNVIAGEAQTLINHVLNGIASYLPENERTREL